MKKITLFDKSFRTFIPNEQIEEAIDKVADKINADFAGSNDVPVLLCILNGSIMFTAELMKRLDFNCELVSMKLSSYEGTSSTGKIRQVMGMTGDIKGKRVIVVEDIVDTGNVKLDYVGMEIPNKFIVGFGLDYNELGRNFKDIYVIDED